MNRGIDSLAGCHDRIEQTTHPLHDCSRRVVGSRQGFVASDRPRLIIDQNKVGEGTTDIKPKPVAPLVAIQVCRGDIRTGLRALSHDDPRA